MFEMNAYALAQLLLHNSILYCDFSVLTRALDALTLTDIVLTVYERIEKDLNSSATAKTKEINSVSTTANSASSASTMVITTGDNVFNRDGLLMSEDSVLSALTQYCVHEMKRREVSYDSFVLPDYHQMGGSKKSSAVSKQNSKNANKETSGDIESLISILQRFENHLIAVQILLRSWTQSSMKVQVSSR
jgi:CCR4-NOT transcriptional regulation complex NOT5 subunit